jgi:hypothetical protein
MAIVTHSQMMALDMQEKLGNAYQSVDTLVAAKPRQMDTP